IRQIDPECVRVTCRKVASRHIEDPDATAIAEGNVGNIDGITDFIYVGNRATHGAEHGQLTASARKYSRRVGDGVPERVAYCELHWDGAAPFAGVNAGAVTIDRLQNHAARIRTAAGAVANRKLPIHVMDIVVASRANAEHRGAWRNRVWRRLRHGSCRITRAGQCDRRDSIAEL